MPGASSPFSAASFTTQPATASPSSAVCAGVDVVQMMPFSSLGSPVMQQAAIEVPLAAAWVVYCWICDTAVPVNITPSGFSRMICSQAFCTDGGVPSVLSLVTSQPRISAASAAMSASASHTSTPQVMK